MKPTNPAVAAGLWNIDGNTPGLRCWSMVADCHWIAYVAWACWLRWGVSVALNVSKPA